MTDWKDNKGSGPWDFIPQPNKFGYLNNPRWSGRQDAVDFCKDHDLSLNLSGEHKPCGHWHKTEVSEEVFPAGKWVAAMQQPGTPYIYVYDIIQKAIIRIDTSEIPVFVSGRLELDSAYALDYDMGWGNPGAQRGGYCMNKDGTRIWYLFTKSDGDRSDAELIEVDISKTNMSKIKSTLYPNLVPSEAFPSLVNERINDGCSDDTHTYWCTNLIAGRIIKIKNSDHSIIDDHTFNYAIECGGGALDEAIATIDVNKNTGKLYWAYCRDHLGCVPSYNACRHLIRADLDLVADIEEVICGTGFGTPGWQNMVRVYSNHVLHHRAYHPSTGPFMKRTLDLSKEDTVAGSAFWQWSCIKDHYATLADRPTSGANYSTYWGVWDRQPGGNVWQEGKKYHKIRILQEYLQNILGVKGGKLFTFWHWNSIPHPAYLQCIDFSNMEETSRLEVSYWAGHKYPDSYDWDWTSVSAMNYQTGVIAIFRYHNLEERNYVGCFGASPSFEFLCDVPLHYIKHTTERELLNEPQSWPFEGFTPPEIPEPDPPVEVILLPGEDLGSGEVIYEPPLPPPDDSPDIMTICRRRFEDTVYVGPGQTRYFKLSASVPHCIYEIFVYNVSEPPYTIHLLVKLESIPTIADFERTWTMPASHFDCNYGMGSMQWVPPKPGASDLYWNYNTGPASETVIIAEPMDLHTFYIMLYNNGRQGINTFFRTLYTID